MPPLRLGLPLLTWGETVVELNSLNLIYSLSHVMFSPTLIVKQLSMSFVESFNTPALRLLTANLQMKNKLLF